MLPLLLLAAAATPVGGPIVVTAPLTLFQSPRVPDRELDKMRGGLNLPNGLNISFGIDLQTRIDGMLALHTTYASDGPNAGLHVYGAGSDPGASGGGTTVNTSAQGGANVVVSHDATGTTVVATPQTMPTDLTVSTSGNGGSAPAGSPLPLVANGGAVQTPAGSYSLSQNDRGNIVTYNAAGIQVQQLVGQATGVAIANTANNRAIDTATTVNVDLGNVPVAQIGASFLAARAALDAGRAH